MTADLIDMIEMSQTLLIKADINVVFLSITFATMDHKVLRLLSLWINECYTDYTSDSLADSRDNNS